MKYLEREMTVRISESDAFGRWRPGAMLTELQEAAEAHSVAMGCGRDVIVEQGIVWVIARLELQILRYPRTGEKVRIRTYHRPNRHRFFPRVYEILDEKGEQVVRASSLWLLMDLETRQSVAADRLGVERPDNSDLPEILPAPGNIERLDVAPESRLYSPVYTDLDVNGHVNNTRYLDWLCNALGTETMREHPPEKILVHYNCEIRPDQPAELLLRRDGLKVQMSGIHDERKAFDIGAMLAETPR